MIINDGILAVVVAVAVIVVVCGSDDAVVAWMSTSYYHLGF